MKLIATITSSLGACLLSYGSTYYALEFAPWPIGMAVIGVWIMAFGLSLEATID